MYLLSPPGCFEPPKVKDLQAVKKEKKAVNTEVYIFSPKTDRSNEKKGTGAKVSL